MDNDTMYNENGSFKPLLVRYGNVDGELSELRNIYMEAEREYFEKLLEDEMIRNYFIELSENYHCENLIREAMIIQEKLEAGTLETQEELELMKQMNPEEREKFHLDKLSKAEGLMCLLLAAARDKAKILELVRSCSIKSSGKSR